MNQSRSTTNFRTAKDNTTQMNVFNKKMGLIELPKINLRNNKNISQNQSPNKSQFNFNKNIRTNQMDANSYLKPKSLMIRRNARNQSEKTLNGKSFRNHTNQFFRKETLNAPVELPEGALFKIDFPDYLLNDIKAHDHKHDHDNTDTKNAFTKFADIKNTLMKTQTMQSEDMGNDYGLSPRQNVFKNDPFDNIMQTLDHNYLQQFNYDSAIMARLYKNIDMIKEKIQKNRKSDDIGKSIRLVANNSRTNEEGVHILSPYNINRKKKLAKYSSEKALAYPYNMGSGSMTGQKQGINSTITKKSDKSIINKGSQAKKNSVDLEGEKSYKQPSWIVYPEPIETEFQMPESRHSATFNLISRSQAILIGGVANQYTYDIWQYNFSNRIWKKIKIEKSDFFCRYGHTTQLHKNQLIVFGGARGTNGIMKNKEHQNDIKIYNFDKQDYGFIQANSYDEPEPRRYHAAAMLHNEFVVSGGINGHDVVLGDVWHFNLTKRLWRKVNIKWESYFEGGIYGHSMNVVKKHGTTFTDIYHKVEGEEPINSFDTRDKLNINIKNEGIMMFGGFNSLDKATNRLLHQQVGSSPVVFSEIHAKGRAPVPRGFHTTTLLNHLGYLCIMGGRNDALYQNTKNISLNDMAQLDLEYFNWHSIRVSLIHPNQIPHKYNHSTIYNNKQLYIFGGFDNNNCMSSELWNLEIRQEKGIRESGNTLGRPDIGHEIIKRTRYERRQLELQKELDTVPDDSYNFTKLLNQPKNYKANVQSDANTRNKQRRDNTKMILDYDD